MDIGQLTCKEIIEAINGQRISSVELVQHSLQNIERYDNILECFISLENKEELLRQAREADERRRSGNARSPLDGVPIAIKDNMHVIGFPTTCGSKILPNYQPSFDATVIERIREQGGIIVGKTNLDEFAMGSTTENSALKSTKNPWDIQRVPGGSSGGSAAAVSSAMVPLALGSDTGGSIREPASFCGIVGIKPTYGLVSRFGLVAYASSLDQIGTFANDTYGAATLLNVIAAFDPKDSTSLEAESTDFTTEIGQSIEGFKIAVFPEFFGEGVSPQIRQKFEDSLAILRQRGAIIEEVPFPALQYVISTYYFIATAEASSNLSRYDGVKYGYRSSKQLNYDEMVLSSRRQGFGKEVKKRILLGNFVLSSGYYDAYYLKAQKLRTHIMNELKKVLADYQAIATPTAIDIAFKFGESESDPLKMYLSDITTVLPNLAGLPAISIPCGLVDNMPVGLQFIGNPLSEALLFQIGSDFESALQQKFSPDCSRLDRVELTRTQRKKAQEIDHTTFRYSKALIKQVSDSYNQRADIHDDRLLCKDLEQHVGEKITVIGSIYRINNLGGLEFYSLRDRSGMTQLVLEGGLKTRTLNLQSVVEVYGLVTKEARSPYNEIEIKVEKLKILGKARADSPINVSNPYTSLNLPTILDNRPISVRNLRIQKIFTIQAAVSELFSGFLRAHDFTEVKTPKIISSGTEGGTNIFELRYFDKVAFLAQSPQFYKQIMVGSGFERVFEIAPVFRAEKHNTIRHLNEYVSLDLEMAFIQDEQDVIDLQEKLVLYMFTQLQERYGDILAEFNPDGFPIPSKIPRIHFLEALEIVSRLGVKDIDGDLSPDGERAICRHFENEVNSPLVYIIGYPMKKRPMYTMPDKRLPGYSRSFDLLYRGLEITTGSQRIHDYEQLRRSIIDKGQNPATFKDYLMAFKYGMPPHGGLAMGLERVTMKLLHLQNVRESTLFPRDMGRLTP